MRSPRVGHNLHAMAINLTDAFAEMKNRPLLVVPGSVGEHQISGRLA